ncbi:MAG TPA: universal stress protein [Mycobacteriales bacterium]|nr:universal stress protein [Mycobacteriales bacterium]
MGSYRTIVVGTDGSESSFVAVDRAAAVAQATGAKLLIACAYTPIDERTRNRASRELGEETYKVTGSHPAEDLLRDADARARKAGATDVTTRSEQGDPVETLVRVIKDAGADLVVVGNRGLNSLAGRLLGSVPANISHRASCDVLIVHTTDGGR